MTKITTHIALLASMLFTLPCVAQSFEPTFDPTTAFVNGQQDLQVFYYGNFDGNVAGIYQQQSSDYGASNSSENNNALIEQIDTEASIAQIWQVGMGNDAQIYQTGYNNIARLAQIGTDHIATLRQEGSANYAAVLMQGQGAFLQATQTGESNYLNATLNTGSQLRISQEGIGNVFSVVLGAGAVVNVAQIRP